MTAPLRVGFPFTGLWLVQNSPARRVPSHGSETFGERFAIDFVGVDVGHRTASTRDWRTFLASEPPDRFVGFGRPILAPVNGTIAKVHDGEQDHGGRRSQLALVPYAIGQGRRIRSGLVAVAGNHVVIAVGGLYIALVHLKAGSIRVSEGQSVAQGRVLAECGNSGNSTEPHVHMQTMDRADPTSAIGVPMTFSGFREWRDGSTSYVDRDGGMPQDGSVIEPLSVLARADG